jgi:hypothetical protein
MAITLPYTFNTTAPFRGVMKFVAWLEVVVVIGILHSFLVRHSSVTGMGLLIVGIFAAAFGVVLIRFTEASTGTITRDEVIVEQGRAGFGFRFRGPFGQFALSQFSSVRAEEASGPVDAGVHGGPHSRIYLAGRAGTPDILIARIPGVGRDAGQELADALGLPLWDKSVPY